MKIVIIIATTITNDNYSAWQLIVDVSMINSRGRALEAQICRNETADETFTWIPKN